ncbi:MAG: DUF4345 family protein [Myxococcota bacterium]
MIERLANVVLWTAIVVFTAVGALGVATSWFELEWLYPVQVVGDTVTLHDQQRFLKALELAWGIALFQLRRDVFVVPHVTRLVLFLFWITPMSRVVSLVLDGLPHPYFQALLAVELLGAVVLTARAVYAPHAEGVRGREPTSLGRTARA